MTLTRFWWALGCAWVVTAIVMCLVPGREIPSVFEWNDKFSHLAGHGALALYFSGLVPRRSWWKIFVFLLVLGALVELAQFSMNVGREGDLRDVVANATGALLGLFVGWLGLARWPQLAAWVLGRREGSA